MTVKLLADRPIDGKEYKAGNLCDTDDSTEAGLIASKLAIADLTGGTAYVAPPVQQQFVPVTATTNLTGGIEIPNVVAGRTDAELATTPTAADIALKDSTMFYDIADPTKRYTLNAARTAFVAVGSGAAVTPYYTTYPDFSPSVLASLSVGTTYGQSGNLVTVASTAHAIPANQNGCRIFWPGSAAIVAGWYLNFTWVDANTFTFDNPTSQTVAGGTALTGALPYVTETAMFNTTLGANALSQNGSSVTLGIYRSGDNTAGAKQIKTLINNQTLTVSHATDGATGFVRSTFATSRGKLLGVQSLGDGSLATLSNQKTLTHNLTVSNTFKLAAQLSAANMWLSVEQVTIEVRK
jgi:hypothetical protein